MNCIVTAGPAFVPLDDVRRLTNFSTGRLGNGGVGGSEECSNFNFYLNPRERSIENYGMDKSENGNCGDGGC